MCVTDQTSFSVQFVLIADDAIDAQSLMRSRFHDLATFLVGLDIALGVFVTLAGNPTVGLAVAFAGAAVLVLTRTRALSRWLIERQSRSLLGLRQLIVITETGIQFESPMANGEIPWAAITEVRENERTVAFVRDRLIGAYIPASAFASPAAREQIVSYARARIAASQADRAI
jgi:hypothetical protein